MTDVYKLSLVATFDDLCRNDAILTTGIEHEFLKFVQMGDACRKKLLETEAQCHALKLKVQELDSENHGLQTKLKHARNQMDQEIKKKLKAEQEKDNLESQIYLVRDIINDKNNKSMLNDKDKEKLAFLSTDHFSVQFCGSPHGNLTGIAEVSAELLSPSELSYDHTEEDLECSTLRSGKHWKRPSAPPFEESDVHMQKSKSSKRKSKRQHRRSKSYDNILAGKSLVPVDEERRPAKRKSSPHKHSSKVRRHSAEDVKEYDSPDAESPRSHYNESPGGSPTLRRYTSAGKGLNRPHSFQQKTSIRPETCIPCGKRIRFGGKAYKCVNCRSTCHNECRELLPLPCVTTAVTPGTGKAEKLSISDHAPADPPYIPALVIHCVNEVECRGLNEVGIYRVPGSDRDVKDLKEKILRGKGMPNLGHINDIHVVCGCLKDFLRNLKEPLVTFTLWEDFMRAAESTDQDAGTSSIYQAVSQLPRANRDTLAFIVLHLQRISECPDCRMSVTNLAKVFGPTLIGFSCLEPEPMQMINQTRQQAFLMERLISLSCDYWSTFINIDDDVTFARDFMTPQTPEAARNQVPQSMLGPISTPNGGQHYTTPRFGSKSRHVTKNPTQFFSSPTLK